MALSCKAVNVLLEKVLSSTFKDHFSQESAKYNEFRPSYPQELFSYLFSLTQNHNRAWDCATGSGQSAIGLAKHYNEVIATDASQNQIDAALAQKNVVYQVESVEQSSLKTNAVDLITVGQALHWFDLQKFSVEVIRVLTANGVLAVWTYGLFDINADINKIINFLYNTTLDDYWPFERKMVEEGYKNINFPLQEIKTPIFEMEFEWDLSQLTGYLCTWSAVKKYKAVEKIDPVMAIHYELCKLWGDPLQTKLVRWPLIMRVWRS